jgi:hypothetical protein
MRMTEAGERNRQEILDALTALPEGSRQRITRKILAVRPITFAGDFDPDQDGPGTE